ncbi:hypothetical protein ACPA0O_00080 [Ectopseudomonas chengduensis]|nr:MULTISPECIES: hypothetical protein [Pseudomonas]MBG0848025.1 hypothetical protein [Pseudomonas chengduensis]MDH1624343.1 hypothetical protein [Pseudomonas chengduensis]MDH1866450.1 hypothetical protein [Pseudomonas chengduensis]
MLELSSEQIAKLDAVRRDEVIEKLLLEVRAQDPNWFAQHGLTGGTSYLARYRRYAEEFGLTDPQSTEDFMRYGLMFPDFHRDDAFVSWMTRPVDDSPEQRFKDYRSVMRFVWKLKNATWN